MNILITVALLSTAISPASPVAGYFTVKNTAPACDNTVLLLAVIKDAQGKVIQTFSRTYTYTTQEIMSGEVSGTFTIPFNRTEPGEYQAVVTIKYCGEERTQTIPFSVKGVLLEKYRTVIGSDEVSFYLTFTNDDNQTHIVYVKSRIDVDGEYKTTLSEVESIPPNSTVEVPVTINLSHFKGNTANVSVSYTYYGKENFVASEIVPLPSSNTGENKNIPSGTVVIAIFWVAMAIIVLMRN